MRTQLRKRQRNQRILIMGVVVAAGVLVVVGAYLLSNVGNSSGIGQPVSQAVYQEMYAASQAGLGSANQSLMTKVQSFNGQPWTSGGKPVIVYIGGEFCPYCSFQRWPLIVALMRFGNFSGLTYMLSSSNDVYPNSPTFSFYGSKYTSNYVVFQGYEQEDRSQRPLQTVPANYTGVFNQFGSGYPFIDIANKYVIAGSFYFPDHIVGKNSTQVAQLLSSNNVVSTQILQSANAITAAICKVTPSAPSSVCGNNAITGLTAVLASYHPPGGVGAQSLIPMGNASIRPWVRHSRLEMGVSPLRLTN